jgi:hypothetical protein
VKACEKCQQFFEAVNIRHKYCPKCKKTGMRPVRKYHAKYGMEITASIVCSRIRKGAIQFQKELDNV